MTVIDQTQYPFELRLGFPTSEAGRTCSPHLSRAFNQVRGGQRVYDAQFHREFDLRVIEYHFKTIKDRENFSQQAKDITTRLLDGQSSSVRFIVLP